MSLSRVLTSIGFILLISIQFATAFCISNLSKKEVSSSSTSPSIYDGKRYNNNIILLQYSNDANHDNESIPPPTQQQRPLSTNNEHLSASQRERREEDKRRKLREGENRPGSTSAIPGAQDYPINVDKTEKEYLQSLSTSDDDSVIDEYNIDKFVALWTDEGLAHLKMLHFQEASESFKKVYEIKPEAYLWQDGLLKYYLEDYHDAAESLARNAVRYETRFGEPASEERIWRDAAELKIIHTINGGRKMKNKDSAAAVRVAALLDKENGVNEEQSEKDSIASERRKVFRLARQLFSSSLQGNSAGMTLARAQLQAMCGDSFPPLLKSTLPTMPTIASEEQQQSRTSLFKARPDHKMYKLHSLFYLGLHYDALGQSYESKQCMKMALKTCANSISGNNQDITYLLPVIHMTIRDWYDDDEWEDDDDDNKEKMELDLNSEDILTELVNDGGVELELKESEADVEQRLRNSIKDMRVVDLKAELKRRSLKVGGTKRVLQDRLIDDLRKSDL